MVEKAFHLTREMLDHSFAETVAPDREKLLTCIQCGTCTASCPTAYAMDYTPRQLWRLIQVGLRDEVLHSRTFWLCTNCYSCTIRCPRGIALTETMATLKRLAIAEGSKEQGTVARFYQSFMDTVRHYGRNFEPEFLALYYGRTNPLGLIGQAPVGLAMLLHNKLPFAPPHTAKAQKDVAAIFRKSLELEALELEKRRTRRSP